MRSELSAQRSPDTVTVLEQLLDLQAHDTRIDQLEHRRATLPQRAELSGVDAELALQGQRCGEVAAQVADLAARQTALESEIEAVSQKAKETDIRLYAGKVNAPRELQALGDELKALARRQDVLEEQLLEILGELEPLEAQLVTERDVEVSVQARRASVLEALTAAEAEVDAEIASVRGERDSAAAGIPPDQLAEYEGLRRRLGGIAVARLAGGSCGGCHLALSAVELDRIRRLPADEPATCEECGRLLVH